MKKSLVLLSYILYVTSIVAQTQYDYYDDDAVAGGNVGVISSIKDTSDKQDLSKTPTQNDLGQKSAPDIGIQEGN